jgi:oxalate decarboxylase
MTTADAATPVKSEITFGNPNDPPQGAINANPARPRGDGGRAARLRPGARRMIPNCLGSVA